MKSWASLRGYLRFWEGLFELMDHIGHEGKTNPAKEKAKRDASTTVLHVILFISLIMFFISRAIDSDRGKAVPVPFGQRNAGIFYVVAATPNRRQHR